MSSTICLGHYMGMFHPCMATLCRLEDRSAVQSSGQHRHRVRGPQMLSARAGRRRAGRRRLPQALAAEGVGARPRPTTAPRRRGASPTGRSYHSIRPLGRRRGGPTPCGPARASGAETGASRDGARAAAARPSGASDEHRRLARPCGIHARPRSSAGARRQRCARGRAGFVRESVSRAISSDRSFVARRRPPHG